MKELREVKTIIEWQIIRDLSTKTIRVSQLICIRDLLKEENLTNYNTLTIPIKFGLFIKINKPNNYNKANLEDYQRLIGKLTYLLYRTRPNIAFVIKRLSKYNANPKNDYLQVAKKVIFYLKSTIYLKPICK